MRELINKLNKYRDAYYNQNLSLVTDAEYDKLFDKLAEMEKKTNIRYPDSPTQSVGFEVKSELHKVKHNHPMLSLDKTKNVEDIKSFLGNNASIAMLKMDGLTCSLMYKDGTLVSAETRGDGVQGEDVLHNAKVVANIPQTIEVKEELIIDGEIILDYQTFEKINDRLGDKNKYKNPRNLASGTIRQLDSSIAASRGLQFIAWKFVKGSSQDSFYARLQELNSIGFTTVPCLKVDTNIVDVMDLLKKQAEIKGYPTDGLVFSYDSVSYGESLGSTSRYVRNQLAFKWQDETAETVLREIEWSASRTGLINPVAIFDPVELEGTSVSRASVHNLSIVESLALGIGDTISVYKANMIIPQIAENLTKSGNLEIPGSCPVCGKETVIRRENDVKVLVCPNEECQAKKIKSFTLFVSRDAMNIDGLSEATLEKFVDLGLIKEPADIFKLSRHKDAIVEMEGFGEKSYENLIAAAEKARNTEVYRFLYSLGIPNIGVSNAKLICREFEQDFDRIRNATGEELTEIPGVGGVIAESFCRFFHDENKIKMTDHLLEEITFRIEEAGQEVQKLAGKTFVITGSVEKYANRKELKDFIESLGGKVTGSVTSKTDYLINNDATSSSSKNKKAKELGVEIITEEQFQTLIENIKA